MIYTLVIAAIVWVLYCLILVLFIHGWDRTKEWSTDRAYKCKTTVTVVIPARNEASNILPCLESILSGTFPKELLRIIVIDDHSSDETVSQIKSLCDYGKVVKCIELKDYVYNEQINSYKKRAIQIAIKESDSEIITTTDADCIVPENWLQSIVSYYEKHQVKVITAPVLFTKENTLLNLFQRIDFTGMMGVTAGGIFHKFFYMGNGANLTYPVSVFHEFNGFSDIDEVASGDDMLFIQKVAATYPQDVHFLKSLDATVFTEATSTLRSFFHQRIRWTSKSGSYNSWLMKAILIVIFLLNIGVLMGLVGAFWNISIIWISAVFFLTKSIFDFYFLHKLAILFKQKFSTADILKTLPIHVLYISIIGFLGNVIKKYQWKGRTVK